MAKGGQSYDVSFIRTDGTTDVGLMLAEDKNGNKLYQRFTDPTLAQQYFTGDVSYGALPPEKELALTQSDWEAGFGLEFASSAGTNPKRYYLTKGADARTRGNIKCSPPATGIALTDYTNTITDGGLETWTDANTLTNWTKSGTGTLDREATIKYAGTYSAKLTHVFAVTLTQSLTWNTKYRNVRVKIQALIRQDVASSARIDIYDGVGTTNGGTSATTGSWVTISCTRALSATATELTIKLQGIAVASGLTYFDVVTWEAPVLGNPVAFAEFNDNWYMAYGDVLVKLNGTGDGFTYVYNFDGTTIIDLIPFSDDNLYISLGASVKYYYMNASEAFTQSTFAGAIDGYMRFAAARGTASGQTMVKNITNVTTGSIPSRNCYKSTDPTNAGSWGTVLTIGNISELIVDMVGDADTIYVAKEDTAWYFDTADDDFMLVEDMQSLKRSDQGKNLIPWHAKVYIPAGANGLVEYNGGVITWRSPVLFQTNLDDFDGQSQALAADEDWLYGILDNGTKVEVIAGQLRDVDGTTIWVWHPLQQITLAGAECAKVSSVYQKRLWIASTDSSQSVFYIPLTNDTYQTGGYLIEPWLHSNLRADNKAYFKLTLTTEGCDANNYITVDYQTYYTALTGAWSNLGNFTTSPTQTKYFSSATGTGEMIRPRYTVVTNSTTTTPKLTNRDLRGIWRPTRRMMIVMTVKLADVHITRDGSAPAGDYTSMKAGIDEAYNKVWPNDFYDIDSKGSTITKVAVLDMKEHSVKLIEGQRNPESLCDLLLEEITLS